MSLPKKFEATLTGEVNTNVKHISQDVLHDK